MSCSLLDDKSAISVVIFGLQLICGQAEPASDSRSRSPASSEASKGWKRSVRSSGCWPLSLAMRSTPVQSCSTWDWPARSTEIAPQRSKLG